MRRETISAGAYAVSQVLLVAIGKLEGVLLRGSQDQISELRSSEDFERLTTRASLIVESVGVVGAYINEGLARGMGIYQAQIGELT